MFQGVPRKVLPARQNKCPAREDFKFPADRDGIHPRSFYNGLTTTSRAHLDATAGGAYLDLTISKAATLIEKMVSNQGGNKERSQPRTKGGMHTIKEMDMLAAKLDLLLKKFDEGNRLQMLVPVMLQTHTLCVRFVVMVDTQGMTAPKSEKMQPTSTTTTSGSVHKETRVGVRHAHHSKEEVTISTQISIRISIQTNPP